MYKKIIFAAVLLAGLTFFSQTALASTYMVYGRVTDGSSNNDVTNGIANAFIIFTPHGSGSGPYTPYSTFSDAKGFFEVEITATQEPLFHFHVTCHATGYTFNDLVLDESDPQFLDFYSL